MLQFFFGVEKIAQIIVMNKKTSYFKSYMVIHVEDIQLLRHTGQ